MGLDAAPTGRRGATAAPSTARPRGTAPRVLAWLLVPATYVALGLIVASGGGTGPGADFWPGAGLALAAALSFGPRILVTIIPADAALFAGLGLPPAAAIGHAAGFGVELLTATLALTRPAGLRWPLDRVRDAVRFLAGGVAVAAFACLTSTVAAGAAPGAASVGMGLGHGLGVLALTPALMSWVADRHLPARGAEFAWMLAAGAALVALGVGPADGEPRLLYAAFPLILWAALRFGAREVALVVLLVVGGLALATGGPGSGDSGLPRDTVAVRLYLLVAGASGLVLAAALAERAAASRRTVENERFHRALLHQMAEGVVVLDSDGRIDHASDRFCELCGRTRDVLIGTRLEDLVSAPDLARTAAALGAAGRGEPVRIEAAMRRPPKEMLFVALSPRPLRDAEGRQRGTLVVISDVTDRRRAEEQSRGHLQQLAHLGRLAVMDQMASTIAHEIAQPLTAITTYAQGARRLLEAGRTSDADDAITGIESGARHATEVLQRIRRFGRDHPPQPVDVEPGALIAEAARLVEPEARQAGIVLSVDTRLRVPRVHADAIQIQQILLNLIHNAFEAVQSTRSGPRDVRVWATAPSPLAVDFYVADSGPGIDDRIRPHLFEAFRSGKDGGVGIGLAISRAIAQAHGGEIEVASTAAHGTTLRLSLPAPRRAPSAVEHA